MTLLTEWSRLTWAGRWSMLWLAVRRRVVAPAPAHERCFMGAPIGDHVRCPRRALFGLRGDRVDVGVWCRIHRPTPDERTDHAGT